MILSEYPSIGMIAELVPFKLVYGALFAVQPWAEPIRKLNFKPYHD